MAKKSAFSKGYRKTKKEKPFLTKNEIIALVIIVAIVLIGALIINQLPKVGTLPARKIQTGDIVSIANREVRNRYMKVGTIGELEGFNLTANTSPKTPTSGYEFTPMDEDSNLKRLRIGGAIWDAERMIASSMAYYSDMSGDDLTATPIETTINGSRAMIGSARITRSAEELANAGEDIAPYGQFIYVYVDSNDGHSVSMTFTLEGEDSSVHIPDEELADFVAQYAGAFNLLEEK